MARKLRTVKGQRTYGERKEIRDPISGQINQVRWFRQFLLGGVDKVCGKWDLICLGHNVLKLFRRGRRPVTA